MLINHPFANGKHPSRFILWLILLILASVLACSSSALTTTEPSQRVTLPADPANNLPQPTQTTQAATVEPTAESQLQEEIFNDSFDESNGWTEAETDRYSAGRAEGGIYQVSFWQAGDEEYFISLQPHQFSLPVQDTLLRVWGTALNGDGAYGLVCRHLDSENMVTFHVSTDGRYWFYKRVNSVWIDLGSGTNPAIGEENVIELHCIGDQLRAIVNGVTIAETYDSSLADGEAGLFAQPLGGALVGAWSYYAVFDSFEMTVLP